jgi:hypothetical protein
MYAGRIFDALVVANGSPATSAAVRMDNAVTMAIQQLSATTAGSVNVAYTYQVSSSNDANATWITPSAPVTIGTAAVSADVFDFSPEAAKFIRIIATNGDAADVTITTNLLMQEAA